jgi:hypothetical protein
MAAKRDRITVCVSASAIRWVEGGQVPDADHGELVDLPRAEVERLAALGAVEECSSARPDEAAEPEPEPEPGE